jgi:hypothetical protein
MTPIFRVTPDDAWPRGIIEKKIEKLFSSSTALTADAAIDCCFNKSNFFFLHLNN